MTDGAVDRGASPVGIVVALLAAVGAVVLVANGPAQQAVLAVEVAGLLAVAIALAATRRGHRVVGLAFGLLGAGTLASALVLGAVLPAGVTERLELLPGAVGVAIVAWGLLPASEGSRRRVALGVGAIVTGVLASGIMHGAGSIALLGALAAAVLAWDAGEQAISLGEQVGRGADTASVELVHAGGTAFVGVAGVFLAHTAYGVDVATLPLAGLVLLLGAALTLVVALYA